MLNFVDLNLLTKNDLDSQGSCSPTVYESAFVAFYSRDFTVKKKICEDLLSMQNPDGSFGKTFGHQQVPTFAALLAFVDISSHIDGILNAAKQLDAAIESASTWIEKSYSNTPELPNTVSSEFVIPIVRQEIIAILKRSANVGLWISDSVSAGRYRNELSYEAATKKVAKLKKLFESAPSWSDKNKYFHLLEILSLVDPSIGCFATPDNGLVACSPAATAAYLCQTQYQGSNHEECLETLSELDGHYSVCHSMMHFEALWTLIPLLESGVVDSDSTKDILSGLSQYFSPDEGFGGGKNLPSDADDTSYFLLAQLLVHDEPVNLAPLVRYWNGEYFLTYLTEDTASETTNAHCLNLLAQCYRSGNYIGWSSSQLESAMQSVASWLLKRRSSDLFWKDKWHASPFYATTAVLTAFVQYQRAGLKKTSASLDSLIKNISELLLTNQNEDGGWGFDFSNEEETGMVLGAIEAASNVGHFDVRTLDQWKNARQYLLSDNNALESFLWMGKDLYSPNRVSKAHSLVGRKVAGLIK